MKANEILNHCYSNPASSIPDLLGMQAPDNAPSHWNAYTGRALLIKVQAQVAAGRGNEEFDTAPSRVKRQATTATTTTTATLPTRVSAILPALSLKFGLGADTTARQFILSSSKPATQSSEAELSQDVKSFLMFFGMDDEEAQQSLLTYAGVKTMRSIKIERIQTAIRTLASIRIDSLSNDRLDDLEGALLAFALTGDSDAE